MIQVEDLTKFYNEFPAIRNLTFSVEEGEIVGFLGPNGAGKTTTIRILTCFMPPTSGNVTIGGFDIFSQSLQVRRIVGYLPENTPLYPELKVREYLCYRAGIKGIKGNLIKKRVEEVAEVCDIKDVLEVVIDALSKGYRQRVGLADCLLADPKVLILDEPTIGLDPHQIIQVRDLIKRLGEKKTILFSSHILSEVEQICDRIIIIHKGRIVASDTPAELTRKIKGGLKIIVIIEGPYTMFERGLKDIPNIKSYSSYPISNAMKYEIIIEKKEGIPRHLFKLAVKSDCIIQQMYFERMSLEEIFLSLTE